MILIDYTDIELGRNLTRRLWTHHSARQPTFNPRQNGFLKACDGNNGHIESTTSKARLDHFQFIVSQSWADEFNELFPAAFTGGGEACPRALVLCTEIITIFRDLGNTSISALIQHLQEKDILKDDGALKEDRVAQQMIFSAIGWISLLYIPVQSSSKAAFSVSIQGTKSEVRPNVSMDKATRPLDELLRSFGTLLPKRLEELHGTSHTQDNALSAAKLLVSYLNVATLKAVGNLNIVWVDSISEHLEFDPTIPSLSIFRCPSFCRTQRALDSTLDM